MQFGLIGRSIQELVTTAAAAAAAATATAAAAEISNSA
jgi:ribosomal protein L12E/L44/L45/RPP1/RPP2